ncbi:MAG: hypothetical protein K6U12_11490 [Armatimonadetes bacterium]|nr:hypothetical protein [Armatimonadota bacterium]CUU33887.1 hypothetical protein DCOP10_1012 [Armatimonadetes bacterium DC]
MKKWMLFGLSLIALSASLVLSACGPKEEAGGGTEPQTSQPSTGGGTSGTTGGETSGQTAGGEGGTQPATGGEGGAQPATGGESGGSSGGH